MLRGPMLEHWAREAQVTPDANARQAPSPRGVTHPRRTHVEQRSGLLNVKQRFLQRHSQNGVNSHDRLPVEQCVAATRRDQTKIASLCLLQISLTCVRFRRTNTCHPALCWIIPHQLQEKHACPAVQPNATTVVWGGRRPSSRTSAGFTMSVCTNPLRRDQEKAMTASTRTLPPDDPTRGLTVTRPETDDAALAHIAIAGDTYTILLSGDDTAGRFMLIDMLVPPGGGPTPHRHDFEETFVVLEGEIEVTFRGETSTLRAGETANIPANAPHFFRNTTDRAARPAVHLRPIGAGGVLLGRRRPREHPDVTPTRPRRRRPRRAHGQSHRARPALPDGTARRTLTPR
jgi:quercetin dioxygenase-like cupin family protein